MTPIVSMRGIVAWRHLRDVHLQGGIGHHDRRCVRQAVPCEVVTRVPVGNQAASNAADITHDQCDTNRCAAKQAPWSQDYAYPSTIPTNPSNRLRTNALGYSFRSCTSSSAQSYTQEHLTHPKLHDKTPYVEVRTCMVFTPGACGSVGLSLLSPLPEPLFEAPRELAACAFQCTALVNGMTFAAAGAQCTHQGR